MVLKNWFFHNFYTWFYTNIYNGRFFVSTNNIEYNFLSRDEEGIFQPHIDIITRRFEYISIFHHQICQEGMFVVVKPTSLLFITPRTENNFTWGDHYTFFRNGNNIGFHKSIQNLINVNYTPYNFQDGVTFFLLNNLITQQSFDNLVINQNEVLYQRMPNQNERNMIRDIFNVIFNPNYYTVPLSSNSNNTNTSGGSTGEGKQKKFENNKNIKSKNIKQCSGNNIIDNIHIMVIKNKTTRLWNTTVQFTKFTKAIKCFGITSKNKLQINKVLECIETYIENNKSIIVLDD